MASLGHMAMRSLAIVGSTGIRGGLPQCLVSLHFPCSNFPNRRAELWKAFKSHPRANVGELRSMSQGAAPSGGAWTLEELVNLSRYPLEEKGPALEELVQKHAKAMERDGFCVLRGFVRPDAARNMLQEVVEVAEDCFVSERNVNPWGENPEKYASTKNKTLPSWHPRRKGLDSAAGVVTCDELPSSGALKTLYAEDHLLDILTRIAGAQQPLCRHADELAACTASVLDSGHSQEWEFVRAPLAAMVVLQNANLGGEIQILPSVYDQVEMGHEVATEVVRTILDAAEVEDQMRSLGMAPPLAEVLDDMDPELGAKWFHSGPLAVQTLKLSPGDVLLTAGNSCMLRFAMVDPLSFADMAEKIQEAEDQKKPLDHIPGGVDTALIVGAMWFETDPTRILSANERKLRFGRKSAAAGRPEDDYDEDDEMMRHSEEKGSFPADPGAEEPRLDLDISEDDLDDGGYAVRLNKEGKVEEVDMSSPEWKNLMDQMKREGTEVTDHEQLAIRKQIIAAVKEMERDKVKQKTIKVKRDGRKGSGVGRLDK